MHKVDNHYNIDDIKSFDGTTTMETEHTGVTQQVDTSKVKVRMNSENFCMPIYCSSFKIAVEDLRDEIQEQSTNSTLNSAAILPTADEMAIIMDAIIHLLQ